MPPEAFIERPMRWLEAMSRHRSTTTTAPNFAYELCIENSTERSVRRSTCRTGGRRCVVPSRCVPPPWIGSQMRLPAPVFDRRHSIRCTGLPRRRCWWRADRIPLCRWCVTSTASRCVSTASSTSRPSTLQRPSSSAAVGHTTARRSSSRTRRRGSRARPARSARSGSPEAASQRATGAGPKRRSRHFRRSCQTGADRSCGRGTLASNSTASCSSRGG